MQITYSTIPLTPTSAPDLQASSDTGSSNTDNITGDTTPTFAVNCSATGNIIKLYYETIGSYTQIGNHICTGTGTEAVTASTLTTGSYEITYTDSNSNGESGHSPALNITIKTSLPQTVEVVE